MRAIFISYRRDDCEGHAGRLYDDLAQRFGENSVFMDVAGIDPGLDFREVIDRQVSSCGVLLAVIGPLWAVIKDESGQRRIDDPGDFVRLETASALASNNLVIPVLVHGAKMPRADQLPDDLKELAFRNGVELTHARWDSDVEFLAQALKRYLRDPAVASPEAALEPAAELTEISLNPVTGMAETSLDPDPDAGSPETAPDPATESPESSFDQVTPGEADLETLHPRPQPGNRKLFRILGVAAVVVALAITIVYLASNSPPNGNSVQNQPTPAQPTPQTAGTPSGAQESPTPAPSGTLVVNTEPAGAEVYLDGSEQGVSPITIDNVLPGARRLTVELAGYDPVELTAIIAPGGTSNPGAILLARQTTSALGDIAGATIENPYVNSLGMRFVPVPGTKVLFSIWDTRVADFRAYVQDSGYQQQGGIVTVNLVKSDNSSVNGGYTEEWDTDPSASWEEPGFEQGPEHPVVGVSWAEAKAFCAWLTEKERKGGLIGAEQEYRLPMDEEWSAAVGEGKYPWGDQWPPPEGAGNYFDDALVAKLPGSGWVQVPGNDGYAQTSPVGSFKANEFGLYDMGGNVWQWCEDWYSGDQNDRVLRGASWRDGDPNNLLSSCRLQRNDLRHSFIMGFRCVLAPVQSTPQPAVAPSPEIPGNPIPNFAGAWELFEEIHNGQQQTLPATASAGRPVTITQDGSLVHIANRALPVSSAGTAGYQTFIAYDSEGLQGHLVQTESEADLAESRTWRLDGSILVAEFTFDYRKPIGGRPAHTDLIIRKYRRVSPTAFQEAPWENSLGMKFVPVPGTQVLFSIWDTRVADFRAYVQDSGYQQEGGMCAMEIVRNANGDYSIGWKFDTNASWERPGFTQGADDPVAGVSWDEAKAFCNWLTKKEQASGKIQTDQFYRLPTDEEWTAAVGNGKYPWGDGWPPPQGAGNYADVFGAQPGWPAVNWR